jgi:hypothetical protein
VYLRLASIQQFLTPARAITEFAKVLLGTSECRLTGVEKENAVIFLEDYFDTRRDSQLLPESGGNENLPEGSDFDVY